MEDGRNETAGPKPGLDFVGSLGAGLALLAVSGWAVIEVGVVRRMEAMFAELDASELPSATRGVFQLAHTRLLEILFVGLLLLGVVALFLVKDRLRANVLTLTLVLLIAVLAVLVRTLGFLPMMKIIEAVGA